MSELRKDPISGRWVIIAPERERRPVFSHKKKHDRENQTEQCAFCKGNESFTDRTIAQIPEQGSWQVRAFANRFPALRVEGEINRKANGIYDYASGVGAHEIIVNTTGHSLELADLSKENLYHLFLMYQHRILDLFNDERLRYVLVYINSGERAGATIEHSHSQLIATTIIPSLIKEELDHCRKYYLAKERCLICDVIQQEIGQADRIVAQNEDFIAFVPYAARVPFEIQIYPLRHNHNFSQIRAEQIHNLSALFQLVMKKIKVGLSSPAFNMMIHTSPNVRSKGIPGQWQSIAGDFHWHIEIVPRLMTMAGFEWGTGFFVNPSSPEDCAMYLRKITIS